MKKQKAEVFIADDGTKFHSEDECLAYEARQRAKQPEVVVASKTADQLLAAVNGSDKPLADAIEALARAVVKARTDRGEFKRPRAKPAAEENAAGETAETADA